jgi:hypothetical protein
MRQQFAMETRRNDEQAKAASNVEFDPGLLKYAQGSLEHVGAKKHRFPAEKRRLERYNKHMRQVMDEYYNEIGRWQRQDQERGAATLSSRNAKAAAEERKREDIAKLQAFHRAEFEATNRGLEQHAASLLYLATQERWEEDAKKNALDLPGGSQEKRRGGVAAGAARGGPGERPSSAPWEIAGDHLVRLRLLKGPRATPM